MGKTSLLESIKMVYRQDGLTGYYKGWIPNFMGSIFFRSIQFSTFESAMTHWETSDSMKQAIPGTGGIQWRVLCAGLLSGSARAIVESPFQYSKCRRQTGQSWEFAGAFKGFSNQYPRATFLMTSFFLQMDSWRRHTNMLKSKFGQFFCSGSAAMIAFWIVWPFDVLLAMNQAETKGVGNTTMDRVRHILKTKGFIGFYRGILPGSLSIFMRNGSAFIVMAHTQKLLTKMGLRN